MFRIRIVAFDLDGSALNKEGRMTRRTKRAFHRAAEGGINLVAATGRTLPFLREVCSGVPLVAPQIVDNGATIVDRGTQHLLRRKSIPRGLIQPTLDAIREAGLSRVWFHPGCIYADLDTPGVHKWYLPSVTRVIEVRNVASLGDMSCVKLGAVGEPDSLRAKREELKRRFAGELNIVQTTPSLLEFLHLDASKGNALGFVARRLRIRREEIMAIGDGDADVDMFRIAGVSIAMGNAPPEVKDAADYITGRNTEGGVAYAIEELILRWLT